MEQEVFEPEAEISEPIPTKERLTFQLALIEVMLGEKPPQKTDEEWNSEVLTWVKTYAKRVSDIIDDIENEKIRALIMQGKHREASSLVLKILDEE